MNKLIAILMILILIFTFQLSCFASELTGKPQDKILIQQEKSIKAYNKLIESIEKDKTKYIDSFAGAYIDDEGFLNVSYVSLSKSVNDTYENLAFSEDIKIANVTYNLTYLMNKQNNILKDKEELSNLGIELVRCAISISDNQVRIYVNDLTKEKQRILMDKYGDSVLNINETDKEDQIAASIINGEALTISGGSGSVGFAATMYRTVGGTTTTVNGIVTAGHYQNMNVGDYASYNSSNVGTVSKYKFSGNCDATFVTLSSGNYGTNVVNYGFDIIGTSSAIQGAYIAFVGQKSGLKYGRIVAVNSSTSYGITDTFKCDFPIISGDSGGPIFYPSGPAGGTKATLIGISTGTNTTHSFYVKLHNIFSGLGLKSVVIN